MRERRGEAVAPKIEATADGTGYVYHEGPQYLPWIPPSDKMTIAALYELADWFTQRNLRLDSVIMPPEMYANINSEVAATIAVAPAKGYDHGLALHHSSGVMRLFSSPHLKTAAFAWSHA